MGGNQLFTWLCNDLGLWLNVIVFVFYRIANCICKLNTDNIKKKNNFYKIIVEKYYCTIYNFI